MTVLPETVSKAWQDREGPAVLTTVSKEGIANVIYVSCVHKASDEAFVVADNFFHKTRKNIQAGSKGALLFITKDNKAFQIKGPLDYQNSGPLYDDMKNNWLDPSFPGRAAAVLRVESVFNGAEQLA